MGSMANAMNEFYRDRISSRRFPTGTAPWKRPTNPRHCCVLATTSNHQGASSRFVIVSRRCRSIAHEILDRVIEKPPSKNRFQRRLDVILFQSNLFISRSFSQMSRVFRKPVLLYRCRVMSVRDEASPGPLSFRPKEGNPPGICSSLADLPPVEMA
uniref:Uncharacterized protein n=1 Tax=Candidatus Kentrum sp. LFY TaxID=2126342 RepID=A0A450UCI1_9GAMM|nr:MAG: hypothetical protein BECKLFY1418A_GA0070994_100926 [Candidatus Kentron sp. LFY]